jgi:NADP-reducing hydrogenase subunit HndB
MTLDELRKWRETKKREMDPRSTAGRKAQVIVGMGTCGIAAGAREVREAFVAELAANRMENVAVRQTGCMGLCFSEPTVEVIAPDMPPVVYGRVDAAVARRIVREHLLGGRLVDGHIYDKPAADLVVAARDGAKE